MGLYFRKRIKVAPGFHLNLSRRGISASIGRRGASFTIGSRGAHVNASIPGTGIYYRQRLWSKKRKPNKKTYSFRTHSSHMFSSRASKTYNQSFNSHLYDDQNYNYSKSDSGITGKGCAKGLLWVLLVINGFVFLVGSLELFLNSDGSAQTSDWIVDCFFGVATICCILLLIKLSKSKTLSSKKQTEDLARQIEYLEKRIEEEPNPLKVRILNNQLGNLISNEAHSRLTPLIEVQSKKMSKNPKPESEQLLQEYESELNEAKVKAEAMVYDIVGELTEEEKKNYTAFCEKYRVLCNSDKAWIVLSKEANSENKASVKTINRKRKYYFNVGNFDYLQVPFDVPLISISGINYYFYPRFVIAARTTDDFEIMPLTDFNMTCRSVRFHEEGEIPLDAQKVGESYKYVNKDGSPDKRYFDNPLIPVLLYGELSIEPIGVTFQVSNNQSVIELKNSFNVIKTSCYWSHPN